MGWGEAEGNGRLGKRYLELKIRTLICTEIAQFTLQSKGGSDLTLPIPAWSPRHSFNIITNATDSQEVPIWFSQGHMASKQ